MPAPRFNIADIGKLSPVNQAEIRAAFAREPHPRTTTVHQSIQPATDTPAKKRIRQNSAGLNKTEARFLAYLQGAYPRPATIHREPKLPLANNCEYWPDFMVTSDMFTASEAMRACNVTIYEVKGRHAWDDAIVKLKVAAALYPHWTFKLATERKSGGWDFQEVLP